MPNTSIKLLVAASLLCLPWQVFSQTNAPVAGNNSRVPSASGTAVGVPVAYPAGTSPNFIREWIPQQPLTSATAVIGSTTVTQATQTTHYIDGLGRTLQTVAWQGSPGKQDIVSPVIYDAFGRQAYSYLSYSFAANSSNSDNHAGTFKTSPFSDQAAFYSTTYPADQPAFQNETFYYGHTDFETSPLQRVTKKFAPGNSWAGSEGSGAEKAVTYTYLNNSVNEAQIWSIPNNALTYTSNDVTTNIPTSSTNYSAGTLQKTVTIDERGNATVEYEDNEGRPILKKVQVGTVAADYSGYSGFLCTFYVYDNVGLLRFVIPPKAVAAMITAGNWTLTANMINELCFRYEFDPLRRMIARKVPGSGWEYMIYDNRDRLVFTQDANMRLNNQWLCTLYDVLNRPGETGMMVYSGSPADLQTYVTNNTSGNTTSSQDVSGNTTVPNVPPDLNVYTRVTGQTTYQASNTITFYGTQGGFTTETGANFVAQIISPNQLTFTNPVTVSNNPIPPTATSFIPLTVTNYDNYSATAKTYDNSQNSRLDADQNPYADPLQSQASINTRGLITSNRIRVLENPGNLAQGGWMETTNFYDDKGRTIQQQADNYKGGIDSKTNLYDFYTRVLCTYEVHNNNIAGINQFPVKTNYDYDHEGRLLTIKKNVNNDGNASAANTTQRQISRSSYDALGLLKEKQVGQQTAYNSAPSSTPLEDDNYSYMIRGWLKGLNWNYPASGATTSQVNNSTKWFGMDISYDWGFGNNQFNGNIAGMRWMSGGDCAERAYGFGYDAVNRLLFGDFNQNFGGTWAKTDPSNSNFTINYTILMGDGLNASTAYDENGNIKQMQQYGLVFNSTQLTSQLIDNLTYNYELGGASNKLSSVSDAATEPAGQNLGDFTDNNTTGDDYGYDKNGNLITDLNKRIKGTTGLDLPSGGAIIYNHLDLPWQISFMNSDGTTPKGTITYIYDALGNKLEKRVSELASSFNNNVSKSTTDSYLTGFVYENNALQYFLQEEGRVRPITPGVYNNQSLYAYDYFVKDNLGNSREVLTDELEQNIYPAATLEGTYGSGTAAVDVEKNYYSIDPTQIATPSGVPAYQNNNGIFNNNPNGNSSANSVNMYKVNGNINPTALGIVAKVMAGDKIDIYGKSYWFTNAPTGAGNSPVTIAATALVTNLLAAPTAGSIIHGANASNIDADGPGTISPMNYFLNRPNSAPTPVAYINYIFFDDQFRYAGAGTSQVSTTISSLKDHHTDLQNISVPKNGYIYVYVSNQSPVDVYFDNLQLVQTRGRLVEENHYYPFGLTMANISDKALKTDWTENKYRYNGKELQHQEFSDGMGLEEYDYGARFMDPQLGRFTTQDPHAYRYATSSPYNYAFNNPVTNIDPTGKDGKVTGTGSENDPLVVTANYYYYGLNEKQVSGLNSALAAYNNKGKAYKVKVNGKEVYVKFNLAGKPVADRKAALAAAQGDTYQASDGNTKRFGNVVDAEAQGHTGNDYAHTDRLEISLNNGLLDKHTTEGVDVDGTKVKLDYDRLVTGAIEHELGHNLTGIHGDDGGLMDKVQTTVQHNQIGGTTTNFTIYPSLSKNAIKAMISRIDKPYGTDYEKDADYIQGVKNGEAVNIKDYGTTGRVYTEKKN